MKLKKLNLISGDDVYVNFDQVTCVMPTRIRDRDGSKIYFKLNQEYEPLIAFDTIDEIFEKIRQEI